MLRISVLSEEDPLFSEIEKKINQNDSIDIQIFQHNLELINHFLSHYASLVILDVDLLKNEILEMIQVLKSIHPDCKIVLFLSPENMSFCSAALSLGVISYQLKPLSVKAVVDFITSLLNITIDQ
ncbi:MAG: DNA-binding response regulator [Calditrichaeota bacterium]|nr:response regulator transcription factor [Calditrichota bacterium]RQV93043.1 MAG: DNA-binding response regulator [bacterium]RQW03934.1 MAG: DNA-binding response regulator [Calditrichota bacterium]